MMEKYISHSGLGSLNQQTAYRPADLARAIGWSSKYGIDVLTIDAAGGGTGMSPWRMMNEWGIPQIELAALMHQYCSLIADKGKHLPDVVLAGGYALEDHIFKGLAFGAPFVKAIGMARAPLTAAMVGRAIERRIEDHTLPQSIEGKTREEVFIASTNLNGRLGEASFKDVPTSALGVYGYLMRVDQGLKQLMAGARKFNLSDNDARPDRNDLAALTEEAAKRSGIQFVMDADKGEARRILEKSLE